MAAKPETAVVPLRQPPFGKWGFPDVAKILTDATPDWYAENEDFAENGDYWREGDGWIGPTGTAAQRSSILERIEPQFCPVDAIGDALDNVENALLKREPRVDIAPLVAPEDDEEDAEEETEEEKVARELKASIATWWDERHFHELLKQATRRARWAERSYLRLWIPPGELRRRADGTLEVPRKEFPEALASIYVEGIKADSAIIYTDPDTQQQASILRYDRIPDGETQAKAFAEVSWVEGEWTIIRTLAESADAGTAPPEIRLKLGGRLTLIECAASLLITEPVRKQAKRLNYFESVLNRNVEMAGFPERATINAEDEGEWEEITSVADAGPYTVEQFNGRTYRLVPVPRTLGAAMTANLRGIKQQDGQLTTPQIQRFDPVDPDLTIKASQHAYRTLARSCKQGHLAGNGTGEASGLAYEQARAAFTDDLFNTKGPVEGLTRNTLSTLMAFAEHISGTPGKYTSEYRVVVDLYVNSGPESSDLLRIAMEAGTKAFLPREDVMARLGVEDPSAAIAAIKAERAGAVEIHEKLAAVLLKFDQAGVLTPELAAAMMESAGIPIEDPKTFTEQLRAAQAAPAGTPGSGLGREGQDDIPIPGVTA